MNPAFSSSRRRAWTAVVVFTVRDSALDNKIEDLYEEKNSVSQQSDGAYAAVFTIDMCTIRRKPRVDA